MSEEKITTKELLKIIGIGTLVAGSLVAPGLSRVYFLIVGKKKKLLNFDIRSLNRQIKRLKARELISFVEEGSQTTIRLAEKGQEKVLRYNFEDMEIERPKKWDGKWRMVIFDIPEHHKTARELFREKLKSLGFYRLQESVFIYPFPCEKEIKFIREYLNISPYVLFLTFKKLESQELKLNKFNF